MSKKKTKKSLKKHSNLSVRGDDLEMSDEQLRETIREFLFTPDAEGTMEAVILVSDMLEDAGVDTKKQKIVWPDGAHHDIDETAKLIKDLTETEVELPLIKLAVIGWLEHVFVPEDASDKEMEYFEAQVENWVRHYELKSGLHDQLPSPF
jgi:hypothetical protein